jgi:hypothetical protein
MKNGRFRGAEAAKFREETPRKGGGITERKSAMTRCSNMPEFIPQCNRKEPGPCGK